MTMKKLTSAWQGLSRAGLTLGALMATQAALATNDLPGGPAVRQLNLHPPASAIVILPARSS